MQALLHDLALRDPPEAPTLLRAKASSARWQNLAVWQINPRCFSIVTWQVWATIFLPQFQFSLIPFG